MGKMALHLWLLLFVALSGCAGVRPAPAVFAPTVAEVAVGSPTYLHDPGARPIHIGDGRGRIQDIPAEFRSFGPPGGYGWKFRLNRAPTGAEFEVAIFSLMEATDAQGCHAYALVNGRRVVQLNVFPGAGSASLAVARFEVKPEEFVAGENRFEIVEAPCLGVRDALNDSLIRSVRVTIR